jgi:hypothetical protein
VVAPDNAVTGATGWLAAGCFRFHVHVWQPYGAGALVAGSGLLGSLATWLVYKNQATPAKFGGAVILLGAGILSCMRDIHGLPILVGAFIGLVMFKADDASAHTSPKVLQGE